MKTSNSGRILMTPGVTVAPFSEAMPAHPQNGDEVIAVNVGSSTYTLTGSITGGDVEIAAGGSVILVYAGQFGWEVTWNSAGGGSVTYPTTVAHGGTGADLSGLDAGQLIAFDGTKFADAVGLSWADGLIASSLSGISALFQTSDAAGGNANPTAVFAGNTDQTAPLTEWRGEDGTTVVASLTVDGSLNLPSTDPLAGINIWGGQVAGGIQIGDGLFDGAPPFSHFQTFVDSENYSRGEWGVGVAEGLLFLVDEGGTQVGNINTVRIGFNNAGTGFAAQQVIVKLEGQDSWVFGGPNTRQRSFTPWEDDAVDLGDPFLKIRSGYFGTGIAAVASIGFGTDGTVNLVADAPGIAGNGFTVEVVVAAGANDNASASFTLQALTVTLGKTAGVLDPAKNTATIIAGKINTEAGGVTATASGTGGDPLTGAEGPTTFTGGAESLTLAGGASIANTIYGSSLAGPSALFQTSATDGSNTNPTVVTRANTDQTAPLFVADPTGAILSGAGWGGASYFGTADWLTDFPAFGTLNVKMDATLIRGVVIADAPWISSGDPDAALTVSLGPTANHLKMAAFFKNQDTDGSQDFIQTGFRSSESPTVKATGVFEFQNSGNGLGDAWFGFNFDPSFGNTDLFKVHGFGNTTEGWLDMAGLGFKARGAIGSGTDGTVRLVADAVGVVGNGFTVQVVIDAGASAPMTAAFTDQALLVTLGTDGGGAPDPTKNTATLVAAAINGEAGGVTATASGTGADPISATSGPTNFTGGAESLTLAGGFSAAGANIYLTNLPGSDPGIAGALYQTAGAVMVSL